MSDALLMCPSCGAEYLAGTDTCTRCRVALVGAPAAAPRAANVVSAESRRQAVEAGAHALKKAGSVLRVGAIVGVVIFLIQTLGNMSILGESDFGPSGVEKLAVVLGSYSTLLTSLVVFGLGTLGQMLADRTLLQLESPSGQ